jgi:hypothetical protein
MLLYIFIIAVVYILKKNERFKFGNVFEIEGDRVVNFPIGLVEKEFDTLFAKRVTDKDGKYRFIVPDNRYSLVSLDSNYKIHSDTEIIEHGKKDRPIGISREVVIGE